MPPRLPWSKLLPGLIALTLVILLCVGVLVFAGVNKIRGETMRLYVLTTQARGLMVGSEVWLAGQKIGVVEALGFRLPTADTLGRVVIALKVRAKDAEMLRRDSPVQVRPGGNVIGPMVVYLESGPPTSPRVRDGDTLSARPQSDFEIAATKLDAATAELPALMTDARTVIGHVRDPSGTVGAVISGRAGGEVARLRASVSALRDRMSGESRHGGADAGSVKLHASSALARVDSIRALLRSPTSSFGRFRRDSTLGRSISSVRDELASIQERLAREQGTLFRARNDSALSLSVANAKREMAFLFDDLRRHPLRYLYF